MRPGDREADAGQGRRRGFRRRPRSGAPCGASSASGSGPLPCPSALPASVSALLANGAGECGERTGGRRGRATRRRRAPERACAIERCGIEVGPGQVSGEWMLRIACEAGSTRTIALRAPSVSHGAPSVPIITPCGGSDHCAARRCSRIRWRRAPHIRRHQAPRGSRARARVGRAIGILNLPRPGSRGSTPLGARACAPGGTRDACRTGHRAGQTDPALDTVDRGSIACAGFEDLTTCDRLTHCVGRRRLRTLGPRVFDRCSIVNDHACGVAGHGRDIEANKAPDTRIRRCGP